MQTFGLQAVRWFTHFTHIPTVDTFVWSKDSSGPIARSFDGLDEKANKETTASKQCSKLPPHPIEKNCEATQPTLGELSKSETDYIHTCTPANTTHIFTRYAFWKQRWTAATRAAKNRILSSFYLSNLKWPPGLLLYHHHVETFRCNRKIQRIVTAPPPPTQGDWTTT